MNFNEMTDEQLTKLVTQLANLIASETRQGINVDTLQQIMDEAVKALRAKSNVPEQLSREAKFVYDLWSTWG